MSENLHLKADRAWGNVETRVSRAGDPPPPWSLRPVSSLHCHYSHTQKKSKRVFFASFLKCPWVTDVPVQCAAFRADFQAGLEGTQSCTSITCGRALHSKGPESCWSTKWRILSTWLTSFHSTKMLCSLFMRTTYVLVINLAEKIPASPFNVTYFWDSISITCKKQLAICESIMDTPGKDELL